MSAKASGRVWDLDLPHNKRLVLLAMVDHADHEGRNIYPSLDLIAWKTGYSYRQVRRIVEDLERDRILVLVKPSRQQHPATYAMDFKAGVIKPPFDRLARKQSRQNVHPENGQDVHPETSRVDISAPPEWTFETPRVDIAMSTKPWNQHEPPTPTAHETKNGGDDDDGFFRELRRRKVGKLKAREIADMECDPTHILALIDNRPDANDPNSLGRLINDILDGVAGAYVPPHARAVTAPPPPAPQSGLTAEQLRELKAKHDYTRHT